MPNFDALVRRSYRDLDGLVLDCNRADATPSRWLNRAPSFVGRPRFGDPFQDVAALRPTIADLGGGVQSVDFERAAQQHYRVPLVGDFGPVSQRWALAFQGVFDPAVVANQQAIFGAGTDDLAILRRNGVGHTAYRHNGSTVGSGAADTEFFSVFQPLGGALVDWFKSQSVLYVNNGAFSDIGFAPDVLDSAFLGRDAIGNYYDGLLDAFQIWARRISPLEVDFAYQTLAVSGADNSVQSRAAVELATWTDHTGGAGQASRIRPTSDGAEQRFWLARGPVGARVQIAAQVDGVTLPDADLGGDLFTLHTLEAPFAEPRVFQDAGWSAVFDVRLVNEGHHSFMVKRADGGGVVLHLDFEAT